MKRNHSNCLAQLIGLVFTVTLAVTVIGVGIAFAPYFCAAGLVLFTGLLVITVVLKGL